jgi:hypothetical protein
MANADLTTGKISGAEEGTKTYYHEQGHLVFEEEFKQGNFIRAIQDLSLKSLIFSTAFGVLLPNNFFKILIVLFIISNIVSELIEEEWCWKYANKKLKGDDKKDDERIESPILS